MKAKKDSQIHLLRSTVLRLVRQKWELAPNGVCQADLESLYNPHLVMALSVRAKRWFVEIDPGLKPYKKGRYI